MTLNLAPPATPDPDVIHLLHEGARRHQERAAPVVFRPLLTVAEREASYRLRGRIVLGKRWAEALPGGLDQDEDDDAAVHIGGWVDQTLVATGRIVFPVHGRLLPTEKAFDLRLADRSRVVEIGRVIVANDWSDASSTVLLALIGALWQHADERLDWFGANSGGVIRTYRRLGAHHETLGPAREHRGEWRYPVVWPMDRFAPSYHALAGVETERAA